MAKQSVAEIMAGVEFVKKKRIANNTVEYVTADGSRVVRLHNTDVVTFQPDGSIVLNTGGWKTATTKDRINDAIRKTGWAIYQEKGVWFLRKSWQRTAENYLFTDGLAINPDGTIEGASGDDVKDFARLNKSLRAYAAAYVAALFAGEVPAPSGGDCWYCSMREVKSGLPWGESSRDVSHLQEHLKESYFVPSLLARAVEVFPVSNAALSCLHYLWTGAGTESVQNWLGDIGKDQLKKSLLRYLKRQFGIAT